MRTGLIAVVLAAVSTAASAQYGQYDPRSNIYNNETLRRQDEIKRNEEAAKRESFYPGQNSEAAEAWSRSQQNGNAARSAQTHAELKAARARLLKMAPLPDDRNPLLGRWRVEGSAKPQRKDDLSLLMGMLANPDLALSLQVGVVDPAGGYQLVTTTEQALAQADQQRREQEPAKAAKNAAAPKL